VTDMEYHSLSVFKTTVTWEQCFLFLLSTWRKDQSSSTLCWLDPLKLYVQTWSVREPLRRNRSVHGRTRRGRSWRN
jgi:hypothetical protein